MQRDRDQKVSIDDLIFSERYGEKSFNLDVPKRLPAMMAVSALIAAASGPLGLLVSWHFEVAAGASIVLVAIAAFAVAAVVRPAT